MNHDLACQPGATVRFAPATPSGTWAHLLGVGDRGGISPDWRGVVVRVADGVAVVRHEPEECACHLEPIRATKPLIDCPRCGGLGIAVRRLLPVWLLRLA